MGDYDSWSDERIAADIIDFLQNRKGIMPWDDWANWRRSKEPYFDRWEEDRGRKCLQDHTCLDPAKTGNHIVELSGDGRKAAKFPGGPEAYWAHLEEQERLKAIKLKREAEPHKGWVWVDRLNKLLPIPTALVAALTLYTQTRQCSQGSSPAPEASTPPIVHLDTARTPAAPQVDPSDSTRRDTAHADTTVVIQGILHQDGVDQHGRQRDTVIFQ